MNIDTSGIEREHLARLLDAEYDLGVTSVAFLPVGEEAYSYVADDRHGARHFIRAQRVADAAGLEAVFTVTAALRDRRGLRQVVAPYRTRRGAFTCRYDGYSIAAFPFIAGATAYEAGLSAEGLAQAARLLAAVHLSGDLLRDLPLDREAFDLPFEAPILRVLRAAEAPAPRASEYQRRVRRLLRAERADIEATLALLGRLGAAARALDLDWRLTHGDPNGANFLIDARGDLHLLDLGAVAFAPPERDLNAFTEQDEITTGARFEAILRHYLPAAGPTRLHGELFTFYTYRWAIGEIADYTTRILFHGSDPEEDRHAWGELAPYLPIRHAEMRERLREIHEIIRRVQDG